MLFPLHIPVLGFDPIGMPGNPPLRVLQKGDGPPRKWSIASRSKPISERAAIKISLAGSTGFSWRVQRRYRIVSDELSESLDDGDKVICYQGSPPDEPTINVGF